MYSSYSQNMADDCVVLFDWGRVNTAHAMASQMAWAIGHRMLMGPETTQAPKATKANAIPQ